MNIDSDVNDEGRLAESTESKIRVLSIEETGNGT